jgi:hypothetical protein
MRPATRMFGTNPMDQIRRRYTGLEAAILCERGLPRILEAADSLVRMMMLHLTYEEQFLIAQQNHCESKLEAAPELFRIEAGLKQQELAAVFHLLRLGRFWMKEHRHRESAQSGCKTGPEKEQTVMVRSALVNPLPATTENATDRLANPAFDPSRLGRTGATTERSNQRFSPATK